MGVIQRFVVMVRKTLSRSNLIHLAKQRNEAWDEVDAGANLCRLIQLAVYGAVDRFTYIPDRLVSRRGKDRILVAFSVAVFVFFAFAMTLSVIDQGILRTIISGGLMTLVLVVVALVGWAMFRSLSLAAKTAATNHCPLENRPVKSGHGGQIWV